MLKYEKLTGKNIILIFWKYYFDKTKFKVKVGFICFSIKVAFSFIINFKK